MTIGTWSVNNSFEGRQVANKYSCPETRREKTARLVNLFASQMVCGFIAGEGAVQRAGVGYGARSGMQ